MSGRSAKEALEALKEKAERAYKRAGEMVRGTKKAVDEGDTEAAADQLGGMAGKARDAIRDRKKMLDEI